jgi:hypothetical protein
LTIKLFTADRAATLGAMQVIGLAPRNGGSSGDPHLDSRLDHWFPDGLSAHGWRWFVNSHEQLDPRWGGNLDGARSAMQESVFEMVRREVRPTAPSRYVSMFACETQAEAEAFCDRFGGVDKPVWRIEADASFRADMSWLAGFRMLEMRANAERYWAQEPSRQPQWEHIVPLPALVKDRAR